MTALNPRIVVPLPPAAPPPWDQDAELEIRTLRELVAASVTRFADMRERLALADASTRRATEGQLAAERRLFAVKVGAWVAVVVGLVLAAASPPFGFGMLAAAGPVAWWCSGGRGRA